MCRVAVSSLISTTQTGAINSARSAARSARTADSAATSSAASMPIAPRSAVRDSALVLRHSLPVWSRYFGTMPTLSDSRSNGDLRTFVATLVPHPRPYPFGPMTIAPNGGRVSVTDCG
jgi:hypothetical protein